MRRRSLKAGKKDGLIWIFAGEGHLRQKKGWFGLDFWGIGAFAVKNSRGTNRNP